MSNFEAEYKKLNKEQRKAVDALDGPVLVVAGPGTGKTQLLSMRVANILKKTDADASSILCLTFTNKAALNMRSRLKNLMGAEARHVVVRTFHSLAAELMNSYPDYFWNGASLSVAPEAVQLEIIQSILANLPLDHPMASQFAGSYTQIGNVKEALKLVKEAGLTPKELRKILRVNIEYINKIESRLVDLLSPNLNKNKLPELEKKIGKLPDQKTFSPLLLPLSRVIKSGLKQAIDLDEQGNKTLHTGKWKREWIQSVDGKKGMFRERKRNEWWLSLADVYDYYREQLHLKGYYDYSDMLIEVLEQLTKHPDMLADIQERFLYVLIDEFQDTNAAQLKLAHIVSDHYSSNGKPNLMAVGDDDQSIFAFNGAELNNVLSFKRSYPSTKLIVLSENYRSHQEILDSAKTIIELAEDRLVRREIDITKSLKAKNPPKVKASINHYSYPTRQHQQLAIAKRVKQLWENNQGTVAVLARKHSSLEALAGLLNRQKVPLRYERQADVLQHEAVKIAYRIAQTSVAIASGDKTAANFYISEILKHPMWKLKPLILWKLAVSNYSSPDWFSSLIESKDKSLASIGHWLSWLSRTTQTQSISLSMEYILGLREGSYLTSPLNSHYISSRAVDSNYVETLSAIEILINLTKEFSGNNQASLADFVRFVELNLSTERVIADESWFVSGKRAVELLTVHKAKGLEYDHVFVIDLTEDMWSPGSKHGNSPTNLGLQSYFDKYDDFVRLLYVAVTRAKSTITATSFYSNDRGDEVLPTPLLSKLPLKIIDKPEDEPAEVLENSIVWPTLASSDEKAILSERLENFELTPSSLINFLNIAEAGPNSFKDRSLLRLPQIKSPAGSYGSAIHAALETAQRLVNTAKLDIGTVLDRFESSLQDENLMQKDYERYRIKGEGLLNKLLINKEFILPKGSLSEQSINNVLVGDAVLKGRLDRLDFPDKTSIIIADYKTGKPLPGFNTQDKTKLVKAWRHQSQLAFYCLLVKNSPKYYKANDVSAKMIYIEAEQARQFELSYKPTNEDLNRLASLIQAVWKHIIKLDIPDTSKYSQDIDGIKQFEQDLIDGKI